MGLTNAERQQRWRDRRAAALLPDPDAPPRDPDDLLLPAVEATIAALQLGEQFLAVAQLARALARTMDEASDQLAAARYLGPGLQKALEALGATPAARARLPKPPPQRSAPSRVAQIRAAHAASPAKRKRMGA